MTNFADVAKLSALIFAFAASAVSVSRAQTEVPVWAGGRDDEPFDVKAFLATRQPPDDNAADLYRLALAPLRKALTDDDSPLAKALVECADVEAFAKRPFDRRRFGELLDKTGPVFEGVEKAQRKPACLFVVDLKVNANWLYAREMLAFSRLCVMRIAEASAQGDLDLVEATIASQLHAARDLQPRGPAVCQLVSIAIERQALWAIHFFLLADSRTDATRVDRMLSLLQDHERQSLSRIEEGMKVDYIVCRNALLDIQAGRSTINEIVALIAGKTDARQSDDLPTPPKLNYEVETKACNDWFARVLVAAKKPNYAAIGMTEFDAQSDRNAQAIADFGALVDKTPKAERPKLFDVAPSCLGFLWIPSFHTLARSHYDAKTHRAGVQSLLAWRRYAIARGKPPNDLAQAVADCLLKTVPTDPFDGKPMRFAIVEGMPTVYSVGEDGVDDGGRIDWKYGTQPGDYLFVFPEIVPASK